MPSTSLSSLEIIIHKFASLTVKEGALFLTVRYFIRGRTLSVKNQSHTVRLFRQLLHIPPNRNWNLSFSDFRGSCALSLHILWVTDALSYVALTLTLH